MTDLINVASAACFPLLVAWLCGLPLLPVLGIYLVGFAVGLVTMAREQP